LPNPYQQVNQVRVPGRSNTSVASTEELIQAYGPRAAEIINESHCRLEDALKRAAIENQHLRQFANQSIRTINALRPHIERYAKMEHLLTNPERLANYTVDFFTKVVPVPPRPNAAAPLVRPDFPSMPTQSGNSGGVRLGDIRPDQRWMVADKMERSGMLRGKQILVQ
jgi:hypothetical protein